MGDEQDEDEDCKQAEGCPEYQCNVDHFQRAGHVRHHAAEEGQPGCFREEARDQDGFHVRLRESVRLRADEAAHRGEVVCVVTTAKELDAANKKEVEGALAGFLKSGEKALISYSVDASIVGGMVVSIADKFVDMSTASKLTKYSELIKGAA